MIKTFANSIVLNFEDITRFFGVEDNIARQHGLCMDFNNWSVLVIIETLEYIALLYSHPLHFI